MSWKKYKKHFEENLPSENQFIVGLDIGNKTSSIAYFDLNKKEPEVMDISGGYGKPSIPTVVQYSYENDDWIYGEYALLNSSDDKDIKIDSLIEKLGKNEILNIDDREIKVSKILGLFIKELLNNCKNLNPKANIAGIVVSIPDYFEPSAITELNEAFNYIGIDKFVIEYVHNRDCIFSRFFYDNEITKEEKILLLDFGSRSLKGSTYNIKPNKNNQLDIECLMSLEDEKIGDDKIMSLVFDLFLKPLEKNTNKKYKNMTKIEKEQLNAFIYSNKDLLFQKSITSKPLKLYYNFIHPPFQQSFSYDEVKDLLYEFENNFKTFIFRVLKKSHTNNTNESLTINQIDRVVCTGGGFEMLWAKNIVKNIFNNNILSFYRNSKSTISEGAAIIAAERLSVATRKTFNIIDKNIISKDIGIKIFKNEKWNFYSIVNKNSFWYYDFPQCILLFNNNTDEPIPIEILEKNKDGKIVVLKEIILDNLPKRPKGTSKFKIKFIFIRNSVLKINIEDYGFGELFPKTDYLREFEVNISE